MTPELRHRSALALFIAMALATACGLPHIPSADPLWWMSEGSWSGLLGAGLVYAGVTWLCASRVLRQVWRHRPAGLAIWASVALVVAALSVWALSLFKGEPGDARMLCWLTTLPLWCCLSGLARAGAVNRGLRRAEDGEDFVEHLGAVDQVHMRSAPNVNRPSAW